MKPIKVVETTPPRIARVDMGVKGFFQRHPQTALRLAGMPASHQIVGTEDSSINTPELRADHVFIVETQSGPPASRRSIRGAPAGKYALYMESQLTPDRRIISLWMLKCAALSRQLKMPVLLLVIYLKQGRYKTFPDHSTVTIGNLTTSFHFSTICLWEHEDAIRSGEWGELAPLLALFDEDAREETLHDIVRLIRESGASLAEQADLLGIGAQIAAKSFPRWMVDLVFSKELEMGKARVRTFMDDWVDEGIAKGKAEGMAQGRGEEARLLTLRVLRKRFGRLPAPIVSHIKAADLRACEDLIDRAIEADSLEDLGL